MKWSKTPLPDRRYDTRGNMTFKTNAGTMAYDSRNRLTSRTHNGKKVTYRYDQNGNMLKGDGRTYNWNRFNKARSVVTAKGATHYTYGGNHSRVKKEVNGVTTYYFGRDYEVTVEKIKGKTVRTMRHHIFAGHELVATHKKVLNDDMKQTDTTAYVHLGSVDTVTNQVAEVVQQQRYTPFGEAIAVVGAKNTFETKDIRGYTSHENVGDTGLINMNARLYDPLIGRFVQADTLIPDAGTAQDYNRYAYVRNNPMKYSDPSGHFPFLLGLGLFLFSMTTDDPFLQKVTGLAGNIIMGGALSFGVVGNGAVLSFIGGTAQGGFEEGVKQGIIGGVTAGLTFGLAEEFGHGYTPKTVVGQMVLQGAIAELKGGKFKHGAISALAGKMGSHYGAKYFGPIGTGSQGAKFGRAAVSAMFGGLAAEASGGSFEDGAMDALFVHLFNDALKVTYLEYEVDTDMKAPWDPDGKDMYLPLGHAAVVSIDENGLTRYYEYGRYGTKRGAVRRKGVPDLIMKNGIPTVESMNKLFSKISKSYGQGKNISYSYHRIDAQDVINYAESTKKGPRPDYHFLRYSCYTFASEAVGHAWYKPVNAYVWTPELMND